MHDMMLIINCLCLTIMIIDIHTLTHKQRERERDGVRNVHANAKLFYIKYILKINLLHFMKINCIGMRRAGERHRKAHENVQFK